MTELKRVAEEAGFECSYSDGVLHCEIRNEGERASIGVCAPQDDLGGLYGGDWWGHDIRRARARVGLA